MIDRRELVGRHDVRYAEAHREAPLSVGNGEFAVTVDVTGLQTFEAEYSRAAGRRDDVPAMPLGTQAQWCYHWAPNPEGYTLDDTMEPATGPRGTVSYPTAYDFREDRDQSHASGRAAGYYYWANPQRVHLSRIAFVALGDDPLRIDEIEAIDQRLDLWAGTVRSRFRVRGAEVTVTTAVDPERDALGVVAASPLIAAGRLGVEIAFPAVEESFEAPPVWDAEDTHTSVPTEIDGGVEIARTLDETRYVARITGADVARAGAHAWTATSATETLELAVEFSASSPEAAPLAAHDITDRAAEHWARVWQSGAALDLSGSTDPRATELERRVVLSQYQTIVNSSGSTPPQETGLVCNSWGGTFHLEMHWWHSAHFAAWGRPEMLENSFRWYHRALPVAREIAASQGFEGARWPKHVGPEGIESPNEIGPLLVWQQPHPIHFAELLFQTSPDPERVLDEYAEIVHETAVFLASYAWREGDGWHLAPPLIPAQEIYGAEQTWDPLFEIAYVRWGLRTAQAWRERRGEDPVPLWNEIAENIRATVSTDDDGSWYDAVQRPGRTAYTDHPSMVAALGVVPDTGLLEHGVMWETLERAITRWNWISAWGWDFPMLSMCATRLDRPEDALDLLLREAQKNVYLANGHNLQVPNRMPLYLPGNGGLLMAVALLFGGWTDPDGIRHEPELPEGWAARAEGFPERP